MYWKWLDWLKRLLQFLSRVYSHASVLISRLTKPRLVTQLTLVRFLTTVNSAVHNMVSNIGKLFATNSTFKRFLSWMTSLVYFCFDSICHILYTCICLHEFSYDDTDSCNTKKVSHIQYMSTSSLLCVRYRLPAATLFTQFQWWSPITIRTCSNNINSPLAGEHFVPKWQPTVTVVVLWAGKQAGWFLRPECAPSSEPRNNADATFLDPHICRRLLLHAGPPRGQYCRGTARYDRREVAKMANAGIAIGANFKIYLLRQLCSNRVQIFFTIHRRHRRKKWRTRSLKIKFCDLWKFF